MAKRYSENEKRSLVASYLASGQSCASYARVCRVSAITLKTWQNRYGENDAAGFEAISSPLPGVELGFRLSIGSAVLDFDRLPPVEWLSVFLKSLAG